MKNLKKKTVKNSINKKSSSKSLSKKKSGKKISSKSAPQKKFKFSRILGPVLRHGEKTVFTDLHLHNKIVCLYFSASWWPPCRGFTPELIKFYNKYHLSKNFEIVFISRDSNYSEYSKYYKKMPWLSVPGIVDIKSTSPFIPQLTIYNSDGKMITDNARNELPKDPHGTYFPWYPKKESPKKGILTKIVNKLFKK